VFFAKWGVFVDLRSGYVIRRVKDLTLIVNPYSRANEGQVEYVLRARADGVPQDTAAYRFWPTKSRKQGKLQRFPRPATDRGFSATRQLMNDRPVTNA
jgi:hypothetical protein